MGKILFLYVLMISVVLFANLGWSAAVTGLALAQTTGSWVDPSAVLDGFIITAGKINTTPRLDVLADKGGSTLTHALPVDSPAINAGNPELCPPTDQRGLPRPVDGDGDGKAICDIGPAGRLFIRFCYSAPQ